MNPYRFLDQLPDPDVDESQEWVDSLDALADAHGPDRARQVLLRVLGPAQTLGIDIPPVAVTESTPMHSTRGTHDRVRPTQPTCRPPPRFI